jgi:hypothetical protein
MSVEEQKVIEYNPGPTAIRFHHDQNYCRLLMGPVGCGKTHTMIADMLFKANNQQPSDDGLRKTRWIIVRNTYAELETTTLEAYETIVAPDLFGRVKRSKPMRHDIEVKLEDGTTLATEIIFLSLDRPEDVKKLGSLRITGALINEMREIHKKVFTTCLERIGRYPPTDPEHGEPGPSWAGVTADTNPPDREHWIYKIFEEDKPKGFTIYKYPPGLSRDLNGKWLANPHAENLKHLKELPPYNNYYLNAIPGKDDNEIRVQLCGEYGYIRDGKPVHPQYNDKLHYADRELEANQKLELCLGWDFGLTPACAICQLSVHGKLEVIDELWSEDLSLREFAEHTVVPHLDRYYSFWRNNYVSVHDPADAKGNEGHTNHQILKEMRIISYPAASNNSPTPRRDALDYFLGRLTGGEPAFSLSSKCPRLRKGLQSEFKYAKIKVNGDDRYFDKPFKNMYSHICEALEYAAMKYARIVKEPVAKVEVFEEFNSNFMGL